VPAFKSALRLFGNPQRVIDFNADSKKANLRGLAFLLADQRPAGIWCGAGDGNRKRRSAL